MIGLHYRDELDEPVAREFDALAAKLRIFMLAEHNEDGTHNFSPDGTGESAGLNPGINESVDLIIDHAQARGQWWKQGPWRLDNPDGAERHKVLLRPPTLAAGTYDDYTPQGIDTAVGAELELSGDVILTGIKALEGLRSKRFFFLRNRSTTNILTLTHQDAGSIASNRFTLPSDTDVICNPNEALWLYYDPLPTATWTLASGASGGTGSVETPPGAGARLMEMWLTDGSFPGGLEMIGWDITGLGTASGGPTFPTDTQYIYLITTGAPGSNAYVIANPQPTQLSYGPLVYRARVMTDTVDQTSHRVWAGLANKPIGSMPMANSDTAGVQCVMFRWNKTGAASAANGNWFIVASDGATQTAADTGVAVIGGASVTPHPYKLVITVSTTFEVEWSIEDVTTSTITTGTLTMPGSPNSTTRMTAMISLTEVDAAVKVFNAGRMSLLTN